jgi:small-conductance mechanosensitive channel
MDILNSYLTEDAVLDLIGSGILLVVLFLIRALADRLIRKNTRASSAERRRWLEATRSVTLGLALFGLIVIWSSALSTFALSLTAFAVAIVIATKELILCLSGAVIRTSLDSVDIGDWVEIDGVAGEVAQNALLTTTLFVLDFKDGSYGQTGRKLTVPNSVFLTTKVFHLPKGAYVLHGFKLTFENLNHLKERLDIVRQALTDATAPFADTLKTEAAAFAKRNDADVGDGGWSIQLITSDLGKPMLNISLLCPVKDAARV